MDKNSINRYNKKNNNFGVINMSTVKTLPEIVKQPKNESKKPQTISDLRKMLAIKTAPGHSLVELYRRGQ
ncbi:hypothetical protein BLL40_08125 [Domibacillus mangrovi]|uniref:Uncharacterized protein n=1 Tax=Domibacillus mangrovi TaxID=1714354 RepID=A0A1Q5P370_9BACI|nr:hypothetical protein BLL40_08125 [Domibacillus mangrovi]